MYSDSDEFMAGIFACMRSYKSLIRSVSGGPPTLEMSRKIPRNVPDYEQPKNLALYYK
jgi:hypothetical protein